MTWMTVIYGFVALALGIEFSALLYENNVSYLNIHMLLFVVFLIIWKTFDDTIHGLILSLICALAAPTSELIILQYADLWHYVRPDFLGIPSWVVWCYAFYTPILGNLARKLRLTFSI